MLNPFTGQLNRTLTGQIFFLKNSNFQNVYNSFPVHTYQEIFKLGNDYIGKFRYNNIIGARHPLKYGFKDKRLCTYNTNLQIIEHNLMNNTVINEHLYVNKNLLSTIEQYPTVKYNIKFNNNSVFLEDIPRDIYNLLIKKTDNDILTYKVNMLE